MTTEYIIALLLANIIGMLYSAGINLAHASGLFCDWEYKWIEVALGVVFTLAPGIYGLGVETMAKVFGLFICTGGWMILGCVVRWCWKHRQNNVRRSRKAMDRAEGKLDGPTT